MLVDQYSYRKLSADDALFDRGRHFFLKLPLLMQWAEEVAVQADSYRVQVGAALEALNPKTGVIGTFVNANDKPYSSLRKRCAEMKNWEEARDEGYTEPIGHVIKGPSDMGAIESITGQATATLHSCDDCLQTADYYSREGELRLGDNSLYVTTGGLGSFTEVQTQSGMWAVRNNLQVPGNAHSNVHNMLGRRNWQLASAAYVAVKSQIDPCQFGEADIINIVLEREAA